MVDYLIAISGDSTIAGSGCAFRMEQHREDEPRESDKGDADQCSEEEYVQHRRSQSASEFASMDISDQSNEPKNERYRQGHVDPGS